MDNLQNLKIELNNYTENVEHAKRLRIANFYIDNMGKNKAASFAVTKEPRADRAIIKIREQNEEIVDREEIIRRLHDNFSDKVGREFQPLRTLESFLVEHGVDVSVLEEDECAHMDEEFTKEEVKKAISSAKAGTAPGPTGQSIALFKYIFCEIPSIFTKSLNELAFVPGLFAPTPFSWLEERRVVFCGDCQGGGIW